MTLDGKVALVTGSSRGIGRAIALTLAQRGCFLAVNYISDSSAADLVINQIGEMGRKAIGFQCDVSNFADAEEMIEKAKSEFGKIDILVNNVRSFFVQDHLRHHRPGVASDSKFELKFRLLLLQSSGADYEKPEERGDHQYRGAECGEGLRAIFGACAYSAAKTGVVVFSKSLAKEEASHGIRVNVGQPGFIETESYTDEMKADMPESVPLKRLGQPEDIANAVAFLASDQGGLYHRQRTQRAWRFVVLITLFSAK